MSFIKNVSAKSAHAKNITALIPKSIPLNLDPYPNERNKFLSKRVYQTPHQHLAKRIGIKYNNFYLEPPAYKPYGNISSSYKDSYPGHKPQFR